MDLKTFPIRSHKSPLLSRSVSSVYHAVHLANAAFQKYSVLAPEWRCFHTFRYFRAVARVADQLRSMGANGAGCTPSAKYTSSRV